MKTELELGDIIKRFELSREINFEYVIESVGKKEAKTSDGYRFNKQLIYDSTKPSDNCIAEVKKIKQQRYHRFFLIKNYEKRTHFTN